MLGLLMSGLMVSEANLPKAFASTSVFREYIDTFDGYSFKYPQNWIQVKGAGADIFFRDPFVLDENLSVEFSSPSSSKYASLEDLGSPEEAGKKVLRQYLTEFMSTRLGVKRDANILNTSSSVADDGKLYYQVEVSQSQSPNCILNSMCCLFGLDHLIVEFDYIERMVLVLIAETKFETLGEFGQNREITYVLLI